MRGKIFVSIRMVDDRLVVGVKLPVSADMALTLPFCESGGRGLGQAGLLHVLAYNLARVMNILCSDR